MSWELFGGIYIADSRGAIGDYADRLAAVAEGAAASRTSPFGVTPGERVARSGAERATLVAAMVSCRCAA
jgi:hypothetical protein